MSSRATVGGVVTDLLTSGDGLTKGAIAGILITSGMGADAAKTLLAQTPGGFDSSVDMHAFIEEVFGADGLTAAFLVENGIPDPSDADIAYCQEQNMRVVTGSFLERAIKMKPMDIASFGTEYFSGALAEKKRLVLISSDAGENALLESAVKPVDDMGAPIVTATWDFGGTPEEFINLLKGLLEKHGTFKTLAMVCHDGGGGNTETPESAEAFKQAQWEAAGKPLDEHGEMDMKALSQYLMSQEKSPSILPEKWFLLKSHGIDLVSGTEDPGVGDIIRTIADAASIRVDVLACSLAQSEQGREWSRK